MVVDYYKLLLQNKLYWCTEGDSRIAYALWGAVQRSLSSDRRGGEKVCWTFLQSHRRCLGKSLVAAYDVFWATVGNTWQWGGWLKRTKHNTRKGIDFMLWLRCENSETTVPHKKNSTFLPSFHSAQLGVGRRVWVIVSLKTKNWATEVTDSPYT